MFMKIATKKITVQNQEFTITNRRAMFWEKEKALVLSDLHIGKTAHFRKNGIALVNTIFEKDLERLSILIDYFQPEKLIIAGDLLHAGDNSEVTAFCDWKNKYPNLKFFLVEGNHDKINSSLKAKLSLDFIEETFEIQGFIFRHDFNYSEKKFQISGHIHPGFVLDSAVKNIVLPCFVVSENQILLPAFSEFTGLDTKNLPQKGRFYVFTDSEIYEI